MTGQQLKNSILQLAVQGKLVPQDPADEPASVLLTRIREEKEQLVQEGKIKKEKNPSQIFRGDDGHFYERIGKADPVCIDEKLPFEIPKSWEWVRFSSVIELQSGQDLTPEKYNSSQVGIPYITGASNIENGNVLINRWTDNGRAFAYQNDLLLTCKGTVGTMAILQEPKVHIARQLMAIRPYNGLEILYMKLVLETLITDLKAAAKSMIPGISRDDILTTLFPLPPLAEQNRIVAKIEELMPFVDRYDALEKQLDTLNTTFPDQLKKSILQYAIQGKLVPQDPTDEPASALLERIRAEREQLIKDGKIKKEKNPSTIYRGEDGHFYEQIGNNEPTCIDDQLPFDIPDSWEWARLGDILSVKGGKRVPKGYTLLDTPTDHIYIRVTDMKNNTLTTNKLKYISDEIFEQIKSYTISKDDLYLTIAGTIGNAGFVPDIFDGMNLTENAVKLTEIKINKLYVLLAILSPFIQDQFVDKTNKVAQPKLAIKRILSTLIPVPPSKEQQRIVETSRTLSAYLVRLAK